MAIGLVMALVVGTGAFFLLRALRRGSVTVTGTVMPPKSASPVNQVATDQGASPTTILGEPAPAATPRRKRAQVPNDNFVDRIALDTPAHATATSAGASNERGEHMQNTRVGLVRWGDTLWWKWTAPMSGPVTVDTSGSTYDTYLAIYTGEVVNALKIVAENDNASEVGVGDSLVTFNAQEGTEYEIQVGSVFTGGGSGSVPAKGTIELHLLMPPSVTIGSPASGSIFPSGSNIAVNVTAKSVTGPITKVSLYRGSTLLGSVSQPPYDFQINQAPVGTNSLYAVAMDNSSSSGTSAVLRVLVAGEGLTLTSPVDNAVFPNSNPILLSAFAMLGTGSLTNVSFSVDGRAVAETANAPFTLKWGPMTSGAHRISARAWDDSGKTYDATPVTISVAQTFFPTGSVWKYLDDGSDQGTKWRAASFNDAAWKSGPAELGYGDGDEATRVEDNDTPGFNARDTEHYITTYFRRSFLATNIAGYSQLLMRVKRDDGAVVHLNGREAARFNMNSGEVNSVTLARNAGDDGRTFIQATVPADFLTEGINVVAVEIHQATGDSTDISFEMDLVGLPVRK